MFCYITKLLCKDCDVLDTMDARIERMRMRLGGGGARL